MTTPASCWTLTEGAAGMESQVRGLTEALGLAPLARRVRVRPPWDWLPGRLWPWPLKAPTADSDPLRPPWPDLVISCGNVAARLAVAVAQASGGRTRLIHIQNPKLPLAWFDVIVAPRHDGLTGANVIVTKAAIHPVTGEKLAAAADEWRQTFAHLPRPLVGVLIGGANRRHRFTPAIASELAARLAALSHKHGAGLVVTPSRRTGPANERVLRKGLARIPAVIWDGTGANPYLGLLALVDVIVVTEDSVSMTSEACATGKPVYVVPLPGRSRRIGAFHAMLQADGITRVFDGTLSHWTYPPLDDAKEVAIEIRHRFGWA